MDASYLQTATDTSDLTTYTFSSQNLGTADADRYIVVVVNSRGVTATLTVSSVTVGGVSASIPVQRTRTTNAQSVCAIAIAKVPTGTTGDVVVTFAVGALRCQISVYRLVGIDSATPHDSDSSASDDPSVTLDIPAGGVAIGGTNMAGAVNSVTWTGLTEDHETPAGAETFESSTAHDVFETEQIGRTITADWSSSSNDVGAFASWAPAAAPSGNRRRRFLLAAG